MLNRLETTVAEAQPDLTFRLPVLRREPPSNAGQWLGLAGAVLLSIGLWLPLFVLAAPLVIGELDSAYFLIMVALACVACLAALRRAWILLGLSGFLVYATLGAAALHAQAQAVPLRLEVQIGFGCLVLVLGAALILAGAAIGDHLTHRTPARSTLPADFEFPVFAGRQSLTALQSGWELRN